MNIGGVLAKQGDIARAKRRIKQALNVFRKTSDQANLAAALFNLGGSIRDRASCQRPNHWIAKA